ncbi:type II secretion system protein N [Marinobacter sp. 1_MG-2023]|uniref:type II secretion system protein N n=1 Tax=Marinobacter sp. 1_MG-2023 TaxID=3062627 RepID=UPI0026E13ECE|nr:type II secretion system protein N [Marinobacter sp. 1_MG-2023]MDO6824980.1 type II secretion system protein N [Marinobacter sp. 1_MG-2023]
MLSINRRVPLILALTAGLAMVALTSWQGYSFWQTESRQAASGTQNDAKPLVQKPSVPSVPLASLDFFGRAQAAGAEEPEDTENLPETNLRIFLRGVLAADGDFPGSALIEDDKSKTEVFLVGDELPSNAKLHSVHPNRVILDRSGKLENLYFPESDNQTGMTFSSDADNIQEDAQQQARVPDITDRSARSITPPANEQERREEIRKRLEQLRERLRTNNG